VQDQSQRQVGSTSFGTERSRRPSAGLIRRIGSLPVMSERDIQMSENTGPRWTVGRLREALARFPDDTPLTVGVPDDDETVEDRYVVIEAGHGKYQNSRTLEWETDKHVTIEVRFEAHAYEGS
jgi:Family of unknown function (DUF6225)